MEAFFIGVGVYLCVLILVCSYRAFWGPTVYDRIISVGVIGTITLVILVLMGFIYERIDMFVDIALVYSILNFTGTLIFSKYFARKGAK